MVRGGSQHHRHRRQLHASARFRHGLLDTITEPGGGVMVFAHDGSNNVTSLTDVDGSVRNFGYDTDHRLTSQTWGGQTDTYSYDSNGLIASVAAGGQSYAVIPQNETTDGQATITDGNSHTTGYGVDAVGRLLAMNQPGGVNQSWSYDVHGDNTSYTDAHSHTTQYQYNAFGQVSEEDDPSRPSLQQYSPTTHG